MPSLIPARQSPWLPLPFRVNDPILYDSMCHVLPRSAHLPPGRHVATALRVLLSLGPWLALISPTTSSLLGKGRRQALSVPNTEAHALSLSLSPFPSPLSSCYSLQILLFLHPTPLPRLSMLTIQ